MSRGGTPVALRAVVLLGALAMLLGVAGLVTRCRAGDGAPQEVTAPGR